MDRKKSNELVLKEAYLERSLIKTIRERQLQFLGHICRHKGFEHLVTKAALGCEHWLDIPPIGNLRVPSKPAHHTLNVLLGEANGTFSVGPHWSRRDLAWLTWRTDVAVIMRYPPTSWSGPSQSGWALPTLPIETGRRCLAIAGKIEDKRSRSRQRITFIGSCVMGDKQGQQQLYKANRE
ncbi:hypothetical protein PoB_005389900 [Plakobranchus ocellatus]|uniref:Uncharacterized protein n=1 Tax=Plakobranchus ocellatus TaxID=259542 RepID=A0AAV4C4C1_9GAST|nr:hypothetical protein PoB_005389900 [Plakobranchus ocellatus]